jgi:replicative DNA helicase
MSHTPFQLEQLVLGMLMRFPQTAPAAAIPILHYNRFIYGLNEKLGGTDHARIMQAIIAAVADKKSATPFNVKAYLTDDHSIYLDALVDMVQGRYRVYDFNLEDMNKWIEEVDKNGIFYEMGRTGESLGEIVKSEKAFLAFLEQNKNTDVDSWMSKTVERFTVETHSQTPYRHISEFIPGVIDFWRRQRSGEQLVVLDCGIPAFMSNGLFPVGELSMVHGMSGGGKSAVVHQTDLGTAIGLYANGVQGCVIVNSLEMSYRTLITRSACLLAGFDSKRLITEPTTISDEDMNRLEEWAWFCERLPIYIDDTNAVNTKSLEYRVRSIHNTTRGPVWRMSIDYLGLLREEDSDSVEQRYAAAAETGKAISRMGPAVVMISQSTFENSKTYHAGLTGMRYSKGIQHAADIVMEVYNPQYLVTNGLTGTFPEIVASNPYMLWMDIQKNRNYGILGWFAVNWTPEYTQMTDPNLSSSMGGQPIIFTHLKEARKMMEAHTVAEVPAVDDTYLGSFS